MKFIKQCLFYYISPNKGSSFLCRYSLALAFVRFRGQKLNVPEMGDVKNWFFGRHLSHRNDDRKPVRANVNLG